MKNGTQFKTHAAFFFLTKKIKHRRAFLVFDFTNTFCLASNSAHNIEILETVH